MQICVNTHTHAQNHTMTLMLYVNTHYMPRSVLQYLHLSIQVISLLQCMAVLQYLSPERNMDKEVSLFQV